MSTTFFSFVVFLQQVLKPVEGLYKNTVIEPSVNSRSPSTGLFLPIGNDHMWR
jgi:hypothetical protein